MSGKTNFPRILLAAPGSGSGKTLITCALLRILMREGLRPGAFKCGPDYIDPMFHKKVLGVPSRNLDLVMAGKEGVEKALFLGSSGRGIGIIEGVMGYYDGAGICSMEGSSYDLCKKTGTPAILVVNARGMSRTLSALISGICKYVETSGIKGIILNNISPAVAEGLKKQIEEDTGVPVIGVMPPMPEEFTIKSRHLGLVMPDEIPQINRNIDIYADELYKNLDLDALFEIAESAEPLEVKKKEIIRKAYTKVAVALDEAFCFYYEDNFDILRSMGADICFFSPIHDTMLPEADRVILGGGYPELYAKELSSNKSMLRSIRAAAENNVPMLAECGGFLYLHEKLKTKEGKSYRMAGVFDGEAYMGDKLSFFGYAKMKALLDNPYIHAGEEIRGHEYHYYVSTNEGDVCEVTKTSGKRSKKEYLIKNNVFAGFMHLYYPSLPELLERFLTL